MYRYETHLHTSPVSECALASVEEQLTFYKELGYDGVFITNHFLDGNINIASDISYEERLNFYCSDYEKGVEFGKKIGIKVFFGVELSYKGTDFLVYGLDKQWFLSHPEIMEMTKRKELQFMMESGALVIQAHPYREAFYIDHIRLFPRSVHGIEVVNANRPKFENDMAMLYAKHYNLLEFAGSDNHIGKAQPRLAGIACTEPISDEADFVNKIKNQMTEIFTLTNA
jgi:predicted metal-dependent phosphoesterase TrpH